MTWPDPTDDQLTRRLGDALKAEVRQHPLPADFAAFVSETLPDRTTPGWWSLTSMPAAAATVVVAIAAVALVLAISPRLIAPAPGSSSAPSDQGPLQTPDPRAVIECQLPDRCDEAANAASPLLPSGPSTWVITFGRGLAFHAEVHACYPGGDYYLVDVFDSGDGPTASVRASGWPDPPCQTSSAPSPSASPLASPNGSSGGLSQDEAVAAAQAAAKRPGLMVLTAVAGPASEVLDASMVHVYADVPSAQTWVWVVNLWDGGPPLGQQGSVVVLDYLDGTVYGVQDWIS